VRSPVTESSRPQTTRFLLITYLHNHGDLFTLQDLLGHSDMAMVKRYARIVMTACAKAHQKASPADNWRL
jgi:site-specific recombinase XerD